MCHLILLFLWIKNGPISKTISKSIDDTNPSKSASITSLASKSDKATGNDVQSPAHPLMNVDKTSMTNDTLYSQYTEKMNNKTSQKEEKTQKSSEKELHKNNNNHNQPNAPRQLLQ
jgi:hypothetical protein